jgi:hypothetical protein
LSVKRRSTRAAEKVKWRKARDESLEVAALSLSSPSQHSYRFVSSAEAPVHLTGTSTNRSHFLQHSHCFPPKTHLPHLLSTFPSSTLSARAWDIAQAIFDGLFGLLKEKPAGSEVKLRCRGAGRGRRADKSSWRGAIDAEVVRTVPTATFYPSSVLMCAECSQSRQHRRFAAVFSLSTLHLNSSRRFFSSPPLNATRYDDHAFRLGVLDVYRCQQRKNEAKLTSSLPTSKSPYLYNFGDVISRHLFQFVRFSFFSHGRVSSSKSAAATRRFVFSLSFPSTPYCSPPHR